MSTLWFVRNSNEYRFVTVEKDGSYRIWAMTGMIGKKHEDFKKYYQHCIKNGWRKASYAEYLAAKYKRK